MNEETKKEFERIIEKGIDENKFTDKEQLIAYLHQVYNDRLHLSNEEASEIIKGILEYYDKGKGNVSNVQSLNLDGVSEINVYDNKSDAEKKYIKISNPDGTYTVLDDNVSKDNFVKQFQDKQNANKGYQTSNGEENKQAIIKDIKENEKEETKLDASTNINNRELTPLEKQEFAAIMGMQLADTNNFIISPENNIYINRDTGETYYVYKNPDGKMEVRKADEREAKTVSSEESGSTENQNNEDAIANSEIDTSKVDQFHSLSDDELQFILDNPDKFDSLTDEQKELIQQIIRERKQNQRIDYQQSKNIEMKNKVYTLKMNNNQFNGFTSLLFLMAITLLYGVIFLSIIINKTGI